MLEQDTELLQALLEDVNHQYKTNGGMEFLNGLKRQAEKWPVMETSIFDEDKLFTIIAQQREEPSWDVGVRLVSTYRHYALNKALEMPSELKDWFDDCLQDLEEGEDPRKSLGIHRDKNRPISTKAACPLRLCATYELFLRQGIKKGKAEDECIKIFYLDKRTMQRRKKDITIRPDIETDVLQAFADYDLSSLNGK